METNEGKILIWNGMKRNEKKETANTWNTAYMWVCQLEAHICCLKLSCLDRERIQFYFCALSELACPPPSYVRDAALFIIMYYYYKWYLLLSQQHTINGPVNDMPVLSSYKIMTHMTK